MAFRHANGAHAGKWEVEGRILMDTGRAILLEVGEHKAWLPKRYAAVLELQGGLVAVLMPDWVAREKGFA